MAEIVYVGPTSYHSSDPWDDDRAVNLFPGDKATVSAEKADQVMRDFPDWFRRLGAAPKKPAAAPKPKKPAASKAKKPPAPKAEKPPAQE